MRNGRNDHDRSSTKDWHVAPVVKNVHYTACAGAVARRRTSGHQHAAQAVGSTPADACALFQGYAHPRRDAGFQRPASDFFRGWPDRTPESTPSAYGEQSDNHTDVITAQETAEAPSKPSKKPPPQILPDWIIGELGKLAEIEPELTPTSALIDAYHVYHTPVALEPARVYAQCANVLAQGKPDLVILVPYLTRGGADLGVLHHVNAAIASGMNVAVIATMNLDSPWKSKLPPNCPFIEYGKLATKLDAHQIRTVLARLLIDSPAQVIHIVNSYLAWEVLQQTENRWLITGKRVYASVFSDGRDADGVVWSYPRFFLRIAGVTLAA